MAPQSVADLVERYRCLSSAAETDQFQQPGSVNPDIQYTVSHTNNVQDLDGHILDTSVMDHDGVLTDDIQKEAIQNEEGVAVEMSSKEEGERCIGEEEQQMSEKEGDPFEEVIELSSSDRDDGDNDGDDDDDDEEGDSNSGDKGNITEDDKNIKQSNQEDQPQQIIISDPGSDPECNQTSELTASQQSTYNAPTEFQNKSMDNSHSTSGKRKHEILEDNDIAEMEDGEPSTKKQVSYLECDYSPPSVLSLLLFLMYDICYINGLIFTNTENNICVDFLFR